MPPELQAELVKLCREDPLREICGMVLCAEGDRWWVWPVDNVHPHPERFYRMDEEQLVAAYEVPHFTVVGEYHSHPHGPEHPSTTDLRYAVPGLRHWIVTPESVIEWESA
jgi:proteasome lid subunit RPN8/RPN11